MHSDQGPLLLYHEKQVASLCGVHCLNTLLQGPTFSGMDLGQIAQELDQQERAFMAEGGMESEDYLRYIAEDSGNVAADGNFSVQVLSKALEVWGLHLEPLDAPHMVDSAQRPEQEDAFICNLQVSAVMSANRKQERLAATQPSAALLRLVTRASSVQTWQLQLLQEHWFTIRRIQGEFWNFNSLFPAPQPLSLFYLSTFLATLREQGYTIFVVRGPLIQQPQEEAGHSDNQGAWFTPAQAKAANAQASDVRQQGYLKAALQGALDKATAGGNLISLKPRGSARQAGSADAAGEWEQWPDEAGVTTSGHATEDDDMQRAIAASLADPEQGSASTSTQPASQVPIPESTSASTASQIQATGPAAVAAVRAMQAAAVATPEAASKHQGQGDASSSGRGDAAVEAEPAAGAGVLELALRLPDNKRLQRRFKADAKLGSIVAFLRSSDVDMAQHVIIRSFPRKVLQDMTQTLADAGLGDKEMLVIDRQR